MAVTEQMSNISHIYTYLYMDLSWIISPQTVIVSRITTQATTATCIIYYSNNCISVQAEHKNI